MCLNCECKRSSKLIQFRIGDNKENTPAINSNQWNNSDLKYIAYSVYGNGRGYLFESIHYDRLPLGGFILKNGDFFNDGEMFTITIL